MTSRKAEMKKHIGTFHQWFYGRHVNDELNLIWGGWFLWVTDWHVEEMKRTVNLKG